MDLLAQLTTALGDRYRVERELGHGGMAVVFLAEDLKHRRRVAVKVLKPELSAVLGGDRFLREIGIAAALQHPHVLPLYDSGQAGGLLYYVMPYAAGESLRQRLGRERQLSLETALQITREVGSALQYAHESGIVHRDIKPENIMLSGGQAVVADFGIARALSAAGADQQLTLTGIVVGTPQYMSPEQAAGAAVDGRSDQYSLACTLYEMLIGEPPFSGPSPQAVIARHSMEPVPSLRLVRQNVPPGTETAIMRAMAKVPADRFPSIQHFLDSLRAGDAATGPTVVPSRARSGTRRRALIGLAAAALAAVMTWSLVARGPSAGDRITSVAVLPFEDFGNPDSSYLGPGMTDGLIADLAQIGSLKVISRSSGAMAGENAGSLGELGSRLGVGAVVRGSIRKLGDSVRVQVRLQRSSDSTLILSKDYEGGLGELPRLQQEITVAVSGALSAPLEGTERSRLAARPAVDQRAYDAYLRGRFHLERGESEQALQLFQQASRIAPQWAAPHVGLANYYTSLPFSTDIAPAEVLPKARASLTQALDLDETLAEAHAANAYIRAYYEWDWRSAEREFRRAIELRPSYADAYFSYSRFLASRRRLDEAIAQLARAVELDPLSLELRSNRALLDYFAGRYDQAKDRLEEVLQTDSTDVLARWGLGLVAEQQGRLSEAIAILEPVVGASLNRKSSIGHTYALAGEAGKARAVLAELQKAAGERYVPAYWFALVYTGLGERDQALRYLERA
ncbi:MAG TPA: protein kinase, partial [Gemmatimonadales bacterium]|nr:protein kinase [Gemmatimonadales bacterium]